MRLFCPDPSPCPDPPPNFSREGFQRSLPWILLTVFFILAIIAVIVVILIRYKEAQQNQLLRVHELDVNQITQQNGELNEKIKLLEEENIRLTKILDSQTYQTIEAGRSTSATKSVQTQTEDKIDDNLSAAVLNRTGLFGANSKNSSNASNKKENEEQDDYSSDEEMPAQL
jgi:hypothetical protein